MYDATDINLKTYDIIKNPLIYFFNYSLNSGVFPNKLKIARVSPILKNKEKNKLANYRPTSALPSILKILERMMYNRLYNYFDKNNLLFKKTIKTIFFKSYLTNRKQYIHYDNQKEKIDLLKNYRWSPARA